MISGRAVKLDYPEGATPLDRNELGGLKHRHVTNQGELDELEQANIASGLRWLARMRRRDILTDDFAVELHRRLFGDVWSWAGSFRKTGKNIGVDPARSQCSCAVRWTMRATGRSMESISP
jgi:fido (protein-threonine AMPylation protein)